MRCKRENLTGYLFLAPCLMVFAVFMLFPVLFSLILSFSDWNLYSGLANIRLVGLGHYAGLLTDDWFTDALRNNLIYSLIVVTATMLISLIVSVLLNDKVYLKKTFRTIFFMPYISNIAAVSMIWMALYQPSKGPLTLLVQALGMGSPKWLSDPAMALYCIMAMTIWAGIGYNIIIYLSGLQSIPNELYEAAEIDGAGAFAKFRCITIPSLSGTTFFLLITTIINSFQVFAPINIMTQGGPGRVTTVLVHYMYILAFRYFNLGKASAIAWVLFGMIFLITLIQFRRNTRHVQ